MIINNLNLNNFRSYKKESINFNPSINILIGDNAQGKTNVLEAIYSLSLARSFKSKDKDVIRNGEQFYKISSDVSLYNQQYNLMMIGANEGKKVFKDKAEINKLSDFIGLLNVVLFSPDDILLLKNGPIEKRKLLDLSLLQLSKEYVEDYQAFKKQLKLRNDYLKYLFPKVNDSDEIKDDMLEILTVNLIECNKKIFDYRKEFIHKLERLAESKYILLSGENIKLKIGYVINFENDIEFYKARYKSDILAGSTQYGVHRDDLKFFKNDVDFELSASQGEQRMLLLSIKLALADLINNIKREAPVVLLDDVFSELDKNHQNRLLSMLSRDMQIIITTTDLLKIGKTTLDKSKIFMVKNGLIKEIQK